MAMSRGISLLCALLAGCTPGPQVEASRAAECRAAFQSYDRAVRFTPSATFLALPKPTPIIRQQGNSARARIQQLGCVTFPREVPQIESVDLAGLEAGPGPAASRKYLHVGILSSNGTEGVLRDRFAALGYPVRVEGAELLGRRFFVGPLSTAGDQARAAQAAEALGFDSAYLLTAVP